MTEMEFEGRTEREAVARAARELGSESFDVELVEKKGNLFSRNRVKIRVKPLTAVPDPMGPGEGRTVRPLRNDRNEEKTIPSETILKKTSEFTEGILERMGYPSTVNYLKREEDRLVFQIIADHANIVIGKRGKNLEALQLLVNICFLRNAEESVPWHVTLDIENYRSRQKEILEREVNRSAENVLKTGSSCLIRPLSPFERRLVHMIIRKRGDLISASEGEGFYKRVRIQTREPQHRNSQKHR